MIAVQKLYVPPVNMVIFYITLLNKLSNVSLVPAMKWGIFNTDMNVQLV